MYTQYVTGVICLLHIHRITRKDVVSCTYSYMHAIITKADTLLVAAMHLHT